VEIGSTTISAVTGDYLYPFLHIGEANPNVTFIFHKNEQEAGYAAWGYAYSSPRQVPGVVAVTLAVGAFPVLTALGAASRGM